MKLRAIGLDLSLSATGIAWSCDAHGQPNLGVRTAASRHGGHERIWDITVEVASASRCDPQIAVIEGYSYGSYRRYDNSEAGEKRKGPGLDVLVKLAELHGVVRQWLWHTGIPFAVVAPQKRAIYATGSGNASKEAVLLAVQRTYPGVYVRDTDQADALVLLAMALDHYGEPIVELPETHRRALASVDWPDLWVPEKSGTGGRRVRSASPGAGAQEMVP